MPRVAGAIRLPLPAVAERQGGQPAVWVLDRASMTVQSAAGAGGGAEGNEAVVAAGLRPAKRW